MFSYLAFYVLLFFAAHAVSARPSHIHLNHHHYQHHHHHHHYAHPTLALRGGYPWKRPIRRSHVEGGDTNSHYPTQHAALHQHTQPLDAELEQHISFAAEASIVSDSVPGTGPESSTGVGTEAMAAPGRQEPVESRAERQFWEPGRFHGHGIRARRVQIMPGATSAWHRLLYAAKRPTQEMERGTGL